MKRLITAALLCAVALSLAGTGYAITVSPAWEVQQLKWTHPISSTFTNVTDSLQACGNSTNLVDTTQAISSANMAMIASSALADTAMTKIRVVLHEVDHSTVTSHVVGAVTIVTQASMDGETWVPIVASTAATIVTGQTSTAEYPLVLGSAYTAGWKSYRWIVTGASATTGCFKFYVSYPSARAH